MAKHIQMVLDSIKSSNGSRKVKYIYKPNKIFDNRITPEAREKTKNMFQVAQEELGEIVFDVNACSKELLNIAAPMLGEIVFDINSSTKDMMTAVEESGIRFGTNKFLKTVF